MHPELLVEWDYEANEAKGRTPETTTPRSSYKAAWVCRTCGKHFETTVNARSARGAGCPSCARKQRGKTRQKPPEGRSLGDLNPLVASNWHPELNGELTPFDVFHRSEIPRWWKCPEGHVEQTPPKRRVKAAHPGGCTVCGGRSVEKGFNDLATTHPHIAEQWDSARNDATGFDPTKVSAGSERTFWWVCKVGHRREAPVKLRVKNAGCPDCRIILTSRTEIEIRCELQAIGIPVEMEAKRWEIGGRRFQLDICVPDWNLIVEFDGRRWHGDSYLRDLRKTLHLESHGWTVIRMRDQLPLLTERDITVDAKKEKIPEMVHKLLLRLRDLNMATELFDEYLAGSDEWAQMEANRRSHVHRSDSLVSRHPQLASEFDLSGNQGLRPESLHPGSSQRVQWRCQKCNHVWKAVVSARAGTGSKAGTGCPACGARRSGVKKQLPKAGQSLADLYPDLVPQWDTERNDSGPENFRPASSLKVWWRCLDFGHSYEATIASRTKAGTGCSVCSGKKILKGENDLATTHPSLLEYWDYENNSKRGIYPGEVTAGSAKKAHWFCARCGVSRLIPIYSAMHGRRYCRACGVQIRVARRQAAPKERSLAYQRPGLLEEWDYGLNTERGLSPEKVFAQSHIKVAWKCKTCGYRWEAKVQSRFNGTGCRKCTSNKRGSKKPKQE